MKTLPSESASTANEAQGALLEGFISLERDLSVTIEEARRLELDKATSDLARAVAAGGRLRELALGLSPSILNAGFPADVASDAKPSTSRCVMT